MSSMLLANSFDQIAMGVAAEQSRDPIGAFLPGTITSPASKRVTPGCSWLRDNLFLPRRAAGGTVSRHASEQGCAKL